VRQEVSRIARTAGYDQRPEDHDGTIGGRVYLNGAPPAGGQPVSPTADAAQVWRDIQGTTSLAVLDDFIARFGDTPIYGPRAREQREQVAREQGKNQVAVMVKPDTLAAPPRSGGPLTAAQERGLKPKDSFGECENCPEMVVVPSGRFTMGSPAEEVGRHSDEGPQHVVTIGRALAVGKFHVARDQFAVFAKETGYTVHSGCDWRNPGFTQEGSHPVVCVSSDDANAYANWLAKKTGKPYRLLSEAEWEYAARGRTSPGNYPRFWFGDDEKDLCQYGNLGKQTVGPPCNSPYANTSPAGHYQPNDFGLYDMFGNAWQWTVDCWHGDYKGAPADGSAWTAGCDNNRERVIRGTGFGNPPSSLRAAMARVTVARITTSASALPGRLYQPGQAAIDRCRRSPKAA
jgi:formylglycine-generating enzyme required for sulfatase activity